MVIRPSPTHHPYWWAGYSIIALFWLACLYLASHQSYTGSSSPGLPIVVMLYVILVVIPIGFVIGIVGSRTISIYLTDSHLVRTRFMREPMRCKRADLARIVILSEHKAPVSIYNPGGYEIPVIAFESFQGKELFRVTSRGWGLADIHKLAAACGVLIEGGWKDVYS